MKRKVNDAAVSFTKCPIHQFERSASFERLLEEFKWMKTGEMNISAMQKHPSIHRNVPLLTISFYLASLWLTLALFSSVYNTTSVYSPKRNIFKWFHQLDIQFHRFFSHSRKTRTLEHGNTLPVAFNSMQVLHGEWIENSHKNSTTATTAMM